MVFQKKPSVYKAVPIDAPVFLELKSVKGLPLEKTIARELKKAGIFAPVFQQSELLDTLVAGDKNIGNSVLNSPFLVAFTLEGKKNLVPLFILRAETNSKKNNAINLVQKVFGSDYTSTKRTYSGRKITSFSSLNVKTEFHFALHQRNATGKPKGNIGRAGHPSA